MLLDSNPIRAYIAGVSKQRKTLLRYLRRQRDLTLDEVAYSTQINVSTLSRAERGVMRLTEDNLNRLARYFRVPAGDLLKEPVITPAEVA